jgi:hypothetical protein
MEAQLVVEGYNLLLRDAQGRAIVPVKAVGIGNYGVKAVVASGKGEHRQHMIFFSGDHYLSSN